MSHPDDPTARFIIEYCVDNNIPYQKDANFVKITFPGDTTMVYFPPVKAIFFSGIKIMESPDLVKIKNFLDYIR